MEQACPFCGAMAVNGSIQHRPGCIHGTWVVPDSLIVTKDQANVMAKVLLDQFVQQPRLGTPAKCYIVDANGLTLAEIIPTSVTVTDTSTYGSPMRHYTIEGSEIAFDGHGGTFIPTHGADDDTRLPDEIISDHMSKLGRKAAAGMTVEERSRRGRKASQARWAKARARDGEPGKTIPHLVEDASEGH